MLVDGMDYVIEGEAMLPQHVADLVDQHPGKIKAVFVGFTEIDAQEKVAQVKAHCSHENDWLINKPDDYTRDHIENMIAYSNMIKAGCNEHGLPYFDTSNDFLGAIGAVREYLVGGLESNRAL